MNKANDYPIFTVSLCDKQRYNTPQQDSSIPIGRTVSTPYIYELTFFV